MACPNVKVSVKFGIKKWVAKRQILRNRFLELVKLCDILRAANLLLKKTAFKICEFQVFATNFVEHLREFRIFHEIVH